MSGFFQAIGAGLVGGGAGFMVGGPIGALAGFGIGMSSAASGMSGHPGQGAMTGGAIGGIAGFMIGGPMGMLVGGGLGALFGGAVSRGFSQQPQPPCYARQYPPYMGAYPGGGMPMGMAFPQTGYGFPQGNYGFSGFQGYSQPTMMQMNIYNFNNYPQYPPQNQPPQQYQPPQPYQPAQPQQPQPQQQGGTLTQQADGKPITYSTSGGYQITVNGHDVTVVDPSGKHTVKQWGDPHEQVDGKDIKSWDEKTRTLLLGDGTRMTMNATGPKGNIESTSIYDGAEQIQINNTTNHIDKVGFNLQQTQQAEHDQNQGETAVLRDRQDGGFVYKDIYKQSADGQITPYHKDIASSPAQKPVHHRQPVARPVEDQEFLVA